jgi:hypothetical protein
MKIPKKYFDMAKSDSMDNEKFKHSYSQSEMDIPLTLYNVVMALHYQFNLPLFARHKACYEVERTLYHDGNF